MANRAGGYSPWQTHHFYWGLLLCLGGFWFLFPLPEAGWWLPAILEALGGLLVVDDLWQHWRQKRDPAYESPAHRWYWRALQWGIGHARWGWLRKMLERASRC